MKTRAKRIFPFLTAACLLTAQTPPEPSAVFRSDSNLVLVPFNVERDGYFVLDVKRADVVLLQDGKPREFTVFEGPGTGGRPPLELTLLFDATSLPPPESKIQVKYTYWNRKATYDFTSHWGDAESSAVLGKSGADVRVSAYRYDGKRLQRLCASTKNPQELTRAIRRLPEPMTDADSTALSVHPGRQLFRQDFPNRVLRWPLSWTQEAMIETMKQAASGSNNVVRTLAVFSETLGPTSTQPQDVADQAIQSGVAVFSVVLDFNQYLHHPMGIIGGKGGHTSLGDAVAIARPDWASPDKLAGHEAPPAPNTTQDANRGPAPNELGGHQGGGPPAPGPVVGNLSTVMMTRFGSIGPLTGGGALYPDRLDADAVQTVLTGIRNRSLNQYLIGFIAPRGPARQHELRIKLNSEAPGKLTGGERTALY